MGKNIVVSLVVSLLLTLGVNAESDGPYVFYAGNTVTVSTITNSNSVQKETYTVGDDVAVLCAVSETGDEFSIPLRKNHQVGPVQYAAASKIVAISDIEGNFKGLTNLMEKAGVINSKLEWTFGTGHFVLIGDVFDRGTRVTECLWLLYKLEAEAEAAGGRVHMLLGNHEHLCLTGDYRYVENKYFSSVSTLGVSEYKDLFDRDTELGRWLRTKNTIVKIGNYVFNHAGVSPDLAQKGYSLSKVNAYLIDDIDGNVSSGSDFVSGSLGCIWYRGYVKAGSSYPKASSSDVAAVMDYLQATRIFVGHCKLGGIEKMYNGSVFGIDVEGNHGASYFEAFYFENGSGYSFDSYDGSKSLLFTDEVSVAQFTLETIESNGTISLSPELTVYDSASVVTVEATPAEGYRFIGWSGDLSGSENPTTIVMDSDKSIEMQCEKIVPGFTVTASAVNGECIITPKKDSYEKGEIVTVVPKKTWGFFFTGWGGDTASFDDTLRFSVEEDRILVGYFHSDPLKADPSFGLAGGNWALNGTLQQNLYAYAYGGAVVDSTELKGVEQGILTYSIPKQENENHWPGAGLGLYVKQSLKEVTHVRLTYKSDKPLYLQLADTVQAPWQKKIPATEEFVTVEIPVSELAQPEDWGLPVGTYNPDSLFDVKLTPAVDVAEGTHAGTIAITGLYLIGVTVADTESVVSAALQERVDYRFVGGTLHLNATEPTKVELYTLSGRVLMQKSLTRGVQKISCAGVAPGVRILRIATAKKETIESIIVR